MALAKLFCYGTLMKTKVITHRLPGYMMFAVPGETFNFPVIQPYPWDDNLPDVFGTIVEVDKDDWEKFDKYEGVDRGMYHRVEATVYPVTPQPAVAGENVWVYVGGPALVHQPIPSGIWR